MRHKFGAIRTKRHGWNFDSKLEASYYDHLILLQKAGEVVGLFRQVPLHLEGGVKLVVDFLIFWADGSCTLDDTKGILTESFKAKKRMALSMYPWVGDIRIIKRGDF